MAPYQYHHQGRSRGLMIALAVIYVGLGLLWWRLDLHPLIAGSLTLATLPALIDVWRNPLATLTLDTETLQWRYGRTSGDLPICDIDHLRFDTRWDFSVRVRIVDRTGRATRLPPPCTPPHRAFESALAERGLSVTRSHF